MSLFIDQLRVVLRETTDLLAAGELSLGQAQAALRKNEEALSACSDGLTAESRGLNLGLETLLGAVDGSRRSVWEEAELLRAQASPATVELLAEAGASTSVVRESLELEAEPFAQRGGAVAERYRLFLEAAQKMLDSSQQDGKLSSHEFEAVYELARSLELAQKGLLEDTGRFQEGVREFGQTCNQRTQEISAATERFSGSVGDSVGEALRAHQRLLQSLLTGFRAATDEVRTRTQRSAKSVARESEQELERLRETFSRTRQSQEEVVQRMVSMQRDVELAGEAARSLLVFFGPIAAIHSSIREVNW